MKCSLQFLATIKCSYYFILLSAIFSLCEAKAEGTNTNLTKQEEFKVFVSQRNQIWKELRENSSKDRSTALDKYEQSTLLLLNDYPNQIGCYSLLMAAMEYRESNGETEKIRALVHGTDRNNAPKWFRLWAKGFLNRLDSLGKPVVIKFTAVDGREVDLTKMQGRVVLVDFWATTCRPCVAEMPAIKKLSDKFKRQGFEVVGISCDTDKKVLQKYLEQNGISWPQFFDGEQQGKNKFTQGFGIDGIPHAFLIDKKGCLRRDNVQQRNDLEEIISDLLAE